MTPRRSTFTLVVVGLAVFGAGIAVGLTLGVLLDGIPGEAEKAPVSDPRQVGLPWAWLAFGFSAQALFMGRMLLQWLVTERRRTSVVPVGFWWLSICGGVMLLIYFLRRGDPVGIVGQLFGVIVYARNLYFIYRQPAAEAARGASSGNT